MNFPLEIVFIIGEKLKFRALHSLRQTCKTYSNLFQDLIKSRRNELFLKYSVFDDNDNVKFVPGPAISNLPHEFPLQGIYFFAIDFSEDDINIFFKNFDGFILGNTSLRSCIATIKTKKKKVHKEDIGCLSQHHQLCHWNDLDADYRSLFHKGKKIMKEFWQSL